MRVALVAGVATATMACVALPCTVAASGRIPTETYRLTVSGLQRLDSSGVTFLVRINGADHVLCGSGSDPCASGVYTYVYSDQSRKDPPGSFGVQLGAGNDVVIFASGTAGPGGTYDAQYDAAAPPSAPAPPPAHTPAVFVPAPVAAPIAGASAISATTVKLATGLIVVLGLLLGLFYLRHRRDL